MLQLQDLKSVNAVQLTIFTDGELRVKPLIIFWGKGKRITSREQLQYDMQVSVQFQDSAWCKEGMMEYWAMNCWRPHVKEEPILLLDKHTAVSPPFIELFPLMWLPKEIANAGQPPEVC